MLDTKKSDFGLSLLIICFYVCVLVCFMWVKKQFQYEKVKSGKYG